jgi:predicted house-cleaning noncanonical NTP pyrophosphatase (MazG superfamily)
LNLVGRTNVADIVPEIIHRDGHQCGVEVMPEDEYVQALKDKLVEEAQEAAAAEPEDLVKELADLYEIVDALMIACGIDRQVVLAKQEDRRQSRGGSTDGFVFSGPSSTPGRTDGPRRFPMNLPPVRRQEQGSRACYRGPRDHRAKTRAGEFGPPNC